MARDIGLLRSDFRVAVTAAGRPARVGVRSNPTRFKCSSLAYTRRRQVPLFGGKSDRRTKWYRGDLLWRRIIDYGVEEKA